MGMEEGSRGENEKKKRGKGKLYCLIIEINGSNMVHGHALKTCARPGGCTCPFTVPPASQAKVRRWRLRTGESASASRKAHRERSEGGRRR